MKQRKALGLMGALLVLGIGACAAVQYGASYALSKGGHNDDAVAHIQAAACGKQGTMHQATIQDHVITPTHTRALRCDTFTITNADNQRRLIAFGQHDHHQAYDGISEKMLQPGEQLTITLNQTGEYLFHDHFEDAVKGTFTVTSER